MWPKQAGAPKLLQDWPAFTPSLVRSSVFAVVAAIVTTILGLVIALLLRQRGSRFGIVGALFLLPLVTAPVLVGVAWKLLLAPVGGGLAGLFDAVGLHAFNPLGSGTGAFLVLLLIHIWQWTPFAGLIAFAALGVVRPELLESARIDGANSWRTFTTVAWPAIAPTILAVVLLELVIGYKVFDLIVVVTAGGPGFSTWMSPYVTTRPGCGQLRHGHRSSPDPGVRCGGRRGRHDRHDHAYTRVEG